MKKSWLVRVIVVLASFAVPGFIGGRIYQEMPPIPDRVITANGEDVVENSWQSQGCVQVDSIWGQSSCVAPDWNDDWLRREVADVLNDWSQNESATPRDRLLIEDPARTTDAWLPKTTQYLETKLWS